MSIALKRISVEDYQHWPLRYHLAGCDTPEEAVAWFQDNVRRLGESREGTTLVALHVEADLFGEMIVVPEYRSEPQRLKDRQRLRQ